MPRHFFKIVFSLLITFACNIGPEPINYGSDACYYCKMNIVDRQHASEIVTKKGKVFKYDAIECMLNDSENNSSEKVALYLVADYKTPGSLIDATKATFLISPGIPSPMNGYLSAFKEKSHALKIQKEKTGDIFNWEEIKRKVFNINPGISRE